MKVAIVEKCPSNIEIDFSKFFEFEYDRLYLTSEDVAKRKKTLNKADVDPNIWLETVQYDYVICVGADAAKHLAKVTQVTKYAGELVKDKFIPFINPAMIRFKPEMQPVLDMAIAKINDLIAGRFQRVEGDYRGITCADEAKKYLQFVLRDNTIQYVAVDTETSSLHPRDGYVLGISISHKTHQGVYISSDIIDEELEKLLQQVFNEKKCIFHNAKFDIKMLQYHFGFKFPDWEDSMLMHYILNENEEHGLKFLAMKYTDMGDYDNELDTWKREYCRKHKVKIRDFTYDLIPFEILCKYASKDTDATLRIYQMCAPIIYNSKNFRKLYNTIMKEGTLFLMEIEEIGVPFDKDRLAETDKLLSDEILRLKQELYKHKEVHALEKEQGVVFNPGSTVQLGKLFFGYLNLPVIKLTATGAPSTDAEVLEELSKENPFAADILNLRKIQKIKSTYIDKVLIGLDSDSRLRTGFNLTTTTSGRLSSSGKLNLQQLPRDDKRVKLTIKSTNADYLFYSQDLTTAEMYYAAVLSGDKELAKVFQLGEDFHSSIAHAVFNLPCEIKEVKSLYPELRQASKAISFGILYGAGPTKIAETAGISFAEAKQVIQQYFNRFKHLKKWLDTTQAEILRDGCIYSAFGRKRRVPNVFSTNDGERFHAMRSALNFTVQSVASDINLLAAIDAHNWIKSSGIRAEIFGLVHDSIIGIVHKDDLEVFKKQLKKFTQMNRDGVMIPGTPIGVDFEAGESYGNVK